MKGIDPNAYFKHTVEFGISTDFLFWISDFLVGKLGLNYFACNFLFSTFGLIGLFIFLDLAWFVGFRKNMKYAGIFILPLILYLPNIHLWTSWFGKDSLIFFGIMLFLYSFIQRPKKKFFYFVLGSFLVFMIRPHVYLLALIALGVTILLWGKTSWMLKLILLFVFSVLSYIIADFVVKKLLGLPNLDPQLIIEFMEKKNSYYINSKTGGSNIDFTGKSLIFKMFSYLFRPLFEKASVSYFIIGIDNLFALFLFSVIFSRKIKPFFRETSFIIKYAIVFVLIEVAFFSAMLSNFGISTRQKTMFMYVLYLFLLGFVAYRQTIKHSVFPKGKGGNQQHLTNLE